MRPLEGKIALVAGATRGGGRGIACMLGEAGATVYCTGRSVRGSPPTSGVYAGRPETIEETAEMVNRFGGRGIAVQVDHTREEQVRDLIARIRSEQGRLDVLVNNLFGSIPAAFQPFWEQPLSQGLRMQEFAVHSHLITCCHAVPLMLERKHGLLVEITDGDLTGYRGDLFFDLANSSKYRIVYAMAYELRQHGLTVLALTPGYLRTEYALDSLGVTEANWQEGAKKDPSFIASESPFYVGRAVAALVADPQVARKSGRALTSWGLAEEYGFTDMDGRQPNLDKYMKEIDHPYWRGAKRFDEAYYEYWGGLSFEG
jgi:NAD(P)-dependent dehydrogenase (short-subunit alcohol dehydrogenase family)